MGSRRPEVEETNVDVHEPGRQVLGAVRGRQDPVGVDQGPAAKLRAGVAKQGQGDLPRHISQICILASHNLAAVAAATRSRTRFAD